MNDCENRIINRDSVYLALFNSCLSLFISPLYLVYSPFLCSFLLLSLMMFHFLCYSSLLCSICEYTRPVSILFLCFLQTRAFHNGILYDSTFINHPFFILFCFCTCAHLQLSETFLSFSSIFYLYIVLLPIPYTLLCSGLGVLHFLVMPPWDFTHFTQYNVDAPMFHFGLACLNLSVSVVVLCQGYCPPPINLFLPPLASSVSQQMHILNIPVCT